MAYATAEDVSGIIDVDGEDIEVVLSPFLETANSLIEEVCVPVGYSIERLRLIEMWLAAHFYAIREMRPSSEKAGSVAESFQYKVDLNLAVTMYGQQAMVLDTAGGLKALNDPKKKTIKPMVRFLGS